jgi:hypothetical protein
VVGLLVHDTRGPPLGLGLFRVTGSTGGRSSWRLAAVVWVSHLLARLNELDKGLGNHAAVKLLEVLESTLIVVHKLRGVSNADRSGLITRGRIVITVGIISQSAVIHGSRGIAAAAADSARRC